MTFCVTRFDDPAPAACVQSCSLQIAANFHFENPPSEEVFPVDFQGGPEHISDAVLLHDAEGQSLLLDNSASQLHATIKNRGCHVGSSRHHANSVIDGNGSSPRTRARRNTITSGRCGTRQSISPAVGDTLLGALACNGGYSRTLRPPPGSPLTGAALSRRCAPAPSAASCAYRPATQAPWTATAWTPSPPTACAARTERRRCRPPTNELCPPMPRFCFGNCGCRPGACLGRGP